MAENDRCIKRTVAGNKYGPFMADHHEWRALVFIKPFGSPPYWIYYCIFCPRLEKRKVEDGIAN